MVWMIGIGAPATAASPHDVFSVTPSNPVFHGLEVKTAIDAKRRWVSLRGPQFYSAPAAITADALPDFLTWYQVRKPDPEPARSIQLTDEFSGEQVFSVTLAGPAFYLIPAQSIRSGPPQEIPPTLNRFLAFQIQQLDPAAPIDALPGKPAFVCLPAEEWHHDDHYPIKTDAKLLMVYETKPQTVDPEATVIDSFGLNRLTIGGQRFLYVTAKRIDD